MKMITRKVPVVFLNVEGMENQVKMVGFTASEGANAMGALGHKVISAVETYELYGCSLNEFCRIAKPMVKEAE